MARGGVVAFTGAGISAEAGIPTFRDPGGVWDRFDPQAFGTWDGIVRQAMHRPDALADFLAELRRVFGSVRPGPAHDALARLEVRGLVDGIITQNVDGLHQDAGSDLVVELHGSLHRRLCLACGHIHVITRVEFLEGLDRAILGLRTAFVSSLEALLPRCPRCAGPTRPDFVAFGEAVHHFPEAERLVGGALTLLVVGTSGEVFPAADLPEVARRGGALVIEVATGQTEIHADLRLTGAAGMILPELEGAVR